MITTKSPAFYFLRTSGEAAELLTSLISPKTMMDITNAVIISKEFSNEIEPIHELDAAIETIKDGLVANEIEVTEQFNPLFYPCDDERLDDALEVEMKSDRVSFNAMHGNPYHAKQIELQSNGETTIEAGVVFQPFDLPGYESIMEARQLPLN